MKPDAVSSPCTLTPSLTDANRTEARLPLPTQHLALQPMRTARPDLMARWLQVSKQAMVMNSMSQPVVLGSIA